MTGLINVNLQRTILPGEYQICDTNVVEKYAKYCNWVDGSYISLLFVALVFLKKHFVIPRFFLHRRYQHLVPVMSARKKSRRGIGLVLHITHHIHFFYHALTSFYLFDPAFPTPWCLSAQKGSHLFLPPHPPAQEESIGRTQTQGDAAHTWQFVQ